VEDEEALILYLHEKGLTPGTQLTVLSSGSQNEGEHEEDFTLQLAAHNVFISKTVAAKIWVTR
jgi:DtxR family Mn-dependent transcriptional regulator